VKTLGYWLMVFVLAATTFFAFRVGVGHGWTAIGMFGLVVALVCFALLLAFGLSMRDRGRRGPPIAR
jgi:hypothetical protein